MFDPVQWQARVEAAEQAAADSLRAAEECMTAATAAADRALACHRDAVALIAGVRPCDCLSLDCPECRQLYGTV